MAAAAAHFLIGWRSAMDGNSASPSRTRKNTEPAMIAMCRPEIDRMCRMPLSRKASLVASEMPPRSPVISALAMAPVSPGSAAAMRAPIAWRTRCTPAHKRQVGRRRGDRGCRCVGGDSE